MCIASMETLEVRLCMAAGGPVSAAAVFDPQPNLADLVTTGKNKYMSLQPGYKASYAGVEDGVKIRLSIAVTKQTKVVDGVTTRVVRERETEDGELVEISWNYFAIDRRTKHIYYFGEDVNNYEDGKIANHDGTWLAGENGASFGLIMPAKPRKGMTFQMENSPGLAEDMATVTKLGLRMTVPAGTFTNVMKMRETNPLEPDSEPEFKFFAPGVGLIVDEVLELVSVRLPK